jgi:indole-3-glycerol phosphate synthase
MTLEDILAACRAESAARQEREPLAKVRRKIEKMGPTRGFARALGAKPFSVIAEIKRNSPTMGVINQAAINDAHQVYNDHPVVSAISVLTQKAQFDGSPDDLETIRKFTQGRNPKPILRKDFIFTEYEVYFSRWIGADAILLMANVVRGREEFKRLHDLAASLGLDVLCEIHDESEISILPNSVKICGINSRKFKDADQRKPFFDVIKETVNPLAAKRVDTKTDISVFELFEKLDSLLPKDCLKVAESGMSADNIGKVLRKYPFNAALIGTALLRSSRSEMPRLLTRIQEEAESALGKMPIAKAEISIAV